MAPKKKTTKSTKSTETKAKKEKLITLTFLPIMGAADQYTALLRKKTMMKDYGREVPVYTPAIEGLPMKLTIKKGQTYDVTPEQLKILQDMGHVETDEEYKAREKFINEMSDQHPRKLTWEMIVAEGSNFKTLRDSQDIVYNDKLLIV